MSTPETLTGSALAAWGVELKNETIKARDENPLPDSVTAFFDLLSNPADDASLMGLISSLDLQHRAALRKFVLGAGFLVNARMPKWKPVEACIEQLEKARRTKVLETLHGVDSLPLCIAGDLRFLTEPSLMRPRPLLTVWREFAVAATPDPHSSPSLVYEDADMIAIRVSKTAEALTARYEARRMIDTCRNKQAAAALAILGCMIRHPSLAYDHSDLLEAMPDELFAAVRTLRDGVLALLQAKAEADGDVWKDAFVEWTRESGAILFSGGITSFDTAFGPSLASLAKARERIARESSRLTAVTAQLREAEKMLDHDVADSYRLR